MRTRVHMCVHARVCYLLDGKLGQRDKRQHPQPNIVHDARQRWVAWRWEARLAPRPSVERPPVQSDTRSNRQQALDPVTLVAGEPVGVGMHLEAPKLIECA